MKGRGSCDRVRSNARHHNQHLRVHLLLRRYCKSFRDTITDFPRTEFRSHPSVDHDIISDQGIRYLLWREGSNSYETIDSIVTSICCFSNRHLTCLFPSTLLLSPDVDNSFTATFAFTVSTLVKPPLLGNLLGFNNLKSFLDTPLSTCTSTRS